MQRQVTLAVSAFLDSPQARRLSSADAARALAEAFFAAAYEDVGKEPRLLDDHDLETLLVDAIPARLKKRDPHAEHGGAVFEALLAHLEETAVVPNAWELRRALDQHAPRFREVVASGTVAGTRGARPETVQHKAARTGRNDPCWCGSGKKFKKCCGGKS